MRAPLCIAVAALLGCTTRITSGVDLSGERYDAAFFVFRDANDHPVRVTEIGERVTLRDREVSVAIVLLSLDEVPASAGKPIVLALRPVPEGRAALGLPETTRAFAIDPAEVDAKLTPIDHASAAWRALSGDLAIAVDPDGCAEPRRSALEAYALRENAVELGNDGRADVIDVKRIDDRFALALTRSRLRLLERGANLPAIPITEEQPGTSLEPPELLRVAPVALFNRVLVAHQRALLLGSRNANPNGWVLELALSDGRASFVRTATANRSLIDADLDERGMAILIDDVGGLHAWTGAEVVPAEMRGPDDGFSLGYLVRWTGDPEAPVLVANGKNLFVYDAASQSWIAHQNTFEVKAIEAAAGGELWAAGEGGNIVRRRTGGDWEPVTVRSPASFAPCAVSSTVEYLLERDGFMYAVVGRCSAMLRIRRSDLCATPIAIDGTVQLASQDLLTVSEEGGEVLAGGEGGRVSISTLE